MRYPKDLKKGDTIGVTAPSFGCTFEPYRSQLYSMMKTFKSMGYEVTPGENCFKDDGIGISTNPKGCARELQEMYASSGNDCLFSAGGGELMCETIQYLDFDELKSARAKWFIGYSDNTNFTFLLNTILDTAAIYGPCAPAFGQKPWHPALQDAYAILTGEKKHVTGYRKWEKDSLKSAENPLATYNVTEDKKLRAYLNGELVDLENSKVSSLKLSGRLLGGCIDCLSTLVGTRFDRVASFNERYFEDGILWFLESCDLNPISLRRTIWQLDQAGWFATAIGFLIGRPYHFGEEAFGLDMYEAVIGILKKYHVPILMDLDIGHLPPSVPIISGAKATVDVSGNDYTIYYEKV